MEQEKMDPRSSAQREEKLQAMYAAKYAADHIASLSSGAGAGSCGQISRAKYWSELSIEEKIERTREQVKGMEYALRQINQLRSEIRRLRADFNEHRHVQDNGTVMLPADRGKSLDFDQDQCCNAAQECDPAKVYF